MAHEVVRTSKSNTKRNGSAANNSRHRQVTGHLVHCRTDWYRIKGHIMNICHRPFTILILSMGMFGCGSLQASSVAADKLPDEQCQAAKQGKLKIADVHTDDKTRNAYLFECAVSVVISMPNMMSGESKSKQQRLTEKRSRAGIADKILAKGIDTEYRNRDGDTLIMAVIRSYMVDKWKEDTVIRLHGMGVPVGAKNNHGKTAMDFARQRKNTNIINFLSSL